jgi:arsenate reductase
MKGFARLPSVARGKISAVEEGVDISQHESKTLQRYLDQPWDHVITVCDEADAHCPMFPGGNRRHHWSFPDPSKSVGSEQEQLAVYRQVRDAIRSRIEAFLRSEEWNDEPIS